MPRKYSSIKPPSQAKKEAVLRRAEACISEFKTLLGVSWHWAVLSDDTDQADAISSRYAKLIDAARLVREARLS